MSKRQPGRNHARTNSPTANHTLSASSARQNLQQGTKVLESLKALASHCINSSNFSEAKSLLERALRMSPEDSDVLVMFAKVFINTGRYSEAVEALKPIFDKELNIPGAHFLASYALYHLHDFELALEHISKALMLNPYESEYLFQKATTLMSMSRYTDAVSLFERLLAQTSDNFLYLNNAGNLYRDLGHFDKAQNHFKQAMQLTRDNSYPYSNYLTTLHYDPRQSQETIYKVCLEWEQRFAPKQTLARPIPQDRSADKRLRIGMISDGFRNHPVGQMIIAPLERLPGHAFQFVCYSSSSQIDHITHRFEKISEYKTVSHLSDEALAQLIREDEIDILFDLAGHNSGTRMRVMAMQPAPILVKWVGGLINTTGLSTIDYLLTDFVESPEGDERFYTEKLIRMPGDYICYEAPPYTPEINTLPAKSNGYITLGCFNNPMKLNPVVLEQWAHIMRQLPDSRLYLKGHQYTSEDLCQRVLDTLEQHDIAPSRITLEGPSKHHELLACYNQVDIALDPWPYSGGLTTCEAFLMGVPVVTRPGPTFAGRHSASHLVSAGMPELVTHSWEEYRSRVIELASDLDSLSTIRSHLRSILLQSPVCDAEAFSSHFGNAMRAIWQRYCDGKQPEAVSFNTEYQVVFADDHQPVQLRHPQHPHQSGRTFNWEFEGKVIAIDHGAQLIDTPVVKKMLDLGTLELITFDPASNWLKHPLRQHASVHYYPNAVLGDGKALTLFACQSAEHSSTLRPSPAPYLSEKIRQALNVLAELPLNSIALDRVSELPNVDWLLLDALHDANALLDNGVGTLSNTLLIHTRIAFQPTHERQASFAEISHWAARHGFRFYCFHDEHRHSAIGSQAAVASQAPYANELLSATALFIPDEQRMSALSTHQKVKLAFIADTAYDLRGLSYTLLNDQSAGLAADYLRNKEDKQQLEELKLEQTSKEKKASKKQPERLKAECTSIAQKAIRDIKVEGNTFIHICFNNMHGEPLLDMFEGGTAAGKYHSLFLIEQNRSIDGYDIDISGNQNAYFFSAEEELNRIIDICLDDNVHGIFFHGLFFSWQRQILEALRGKKQTVWPIWGGDLYKNIANKKVIEIIDNDIDYIATSLDSEIKLFEQHFKPKPVITIQYDFGYEVVQPKPRKQNLIFIGNSGDPSNNHLDIIKAVAAMQDINDYEIVIPYTYNGTQEGYDAIKAAVQASNLKKVSILTQHLNKKDYYELLSQAVLYISAHNRQQGFGHIAACLYLGVNVVLKEFIEVDGKTISNPVWTRIVDTQGFSLESFEAFSQTRSIAESLRERQVLENQQRSREYYGRKATEKTFLNAYERLERDSLRLGNSQPVRQADPLSSPQRLREILSSLQAQRAARESQIPKSSLPRQLTDNCQALTNREVLLELLPKNAVVAEIGVDEGKFSDQILSISKPERLHLIDIWGTDRFHDGKYRSICQKLSRRIDKGEVVIHKKLSTEASDDFNDDYFDWIYIDTDHSYETTRDELLKYAPKVKADGIICGHDYTMGNWITGYRYGVIEAVHEFCIQHGWELIYITLDTSENQSFAIRRLQQD